MNARYVVWVCDQEVDSETGACAPSRHNLPLRQSGDPDAATDAAWDMVKDQGVESVVVWSITEAGCINPERFVGFLPAAHLEHTWKLKDWLDEQQQAMCAVAMRDTLFEPSL